MGSDLLRASIGEGAEQVPTWQPAAHSQGQCRRLGQPGWASVGPGSSVEPAGMAPTGSTRRVRVSPRHTVGAQGKRLLSRRWDGQWRSEDKTPNWMGVSGSPLIGFRAQDYSHRLKRGLTCAKINGIKSPSLGLFSLVRCPQATR